MTTLHYHTDFRQSQTEVINQLNQRINNLSQSCEQLLQIIKSKTYDQNQCICNQQIQASSNTLAQTISKNTKYLLQTKVQSSLISSQYFLNGDFQLNIQNIVKQSYSKTFDSVRTKINRKKQSWKTQIYKIKQKLQAVLDQKQPKIACAQQRQIIQIPIELNIVKETIQMQIQTEIQNIRESLMTAYQWASQNKSKVIQVPIEMIVEKIVTKFVQIPVYIKQIVQIPVELRQIVQIPAKIQKQFIQIPVELQTVLEVPVQIFLEKQSEQFGCQAFDITLSSIQIQTDFQKVDQFQIYQIPVQVQLVDMSLVSKKMSEVGTDKTVCHEQIQTQDRNSQIKIVEVPVQMNVYSMLQFQNQSLRSIKMDEQQRCNPLNFHSSPNSIHQQNFQFQQNTIPRLQNNSNLEQLDEEVKFNNIFQIPVQISLIKESFDVQTQTQQRQQDQLKEVQIVQVQVEVPVQIIVQKLVEVIVQKQIYITEYIQIPVEVFIQKVVEVPIEIQIIIQRITEVPVQVFVQKIVKVVVIQQKVIQIPVQIITQKIVQIVVLQQKIIQIPVQLFVQKNDQFQGQIKQKYQIRKYRSTPNNKQVLNQTQSKKIFIDSNQNDANNQQADYKQEQVKLQSVSHQARQQNSQLKQIIIQNQIVQVPVQIYIQVIKQKIVQVPVYIYEKQVIQVPVEVYIYRNIQIPIIQIQKQFIQVPVQLQVQRQKQQNYQQKLSLNTLPIQSLKAQKQIIQVPVQIYIDRIVEVIVQKIIEVPVQIFVQKIVQVPIFIKQKEFIQIPIEVQIITQVPVYIKQFIEIPTEIIIQRIVQVPIFIKQIIQVPIEMLLQKQKIVQVPVYIKQFIQIPTEVIVQKIVQIPIIQYQKQFIQVPTEILIEKIVQVPLIVYQKQFIQIPIQLNMEKETYKVQIQNENNNQQIQSYQNQNFKLASGKVEKIQLYGNSIQTKREICQIPIQLFIQRETQRQVVYEKQFIQIPIQVQVQKIVQVPVFIQKKQYIEIPVQIIVLKIVQVFVEKIVEVVVYQKQFIQIPVQIITEIPIYLQKIIQIPAQIQTISQAPICIQRILQLPVEIIVQKIVQIPVQIQILKFVQVQVKVKEFIQIPVQIFVKHEQQYTIDSQLNQSQQFVSNFKNYWSLLSNNDKNEFSQLFKQFQRQKKQVIIQQAPQQFKDIDTLLSNYEPEMDLHKYKLKTVQQNYLNKTQSIEQQSKVQNIKERLVTVKQFIQVPIQIFIYIQKAEVQTNSIQIQTESLQYCNSHYICQVPVQLNIYNSQLQENNFFRSQINAGNKQNQYEFNQFSKSQAQIYQIPVQINVQKEAKDMQIQTETEALSSDIQPYSTIKHNFKIPNFKQQKVQEDNQPAIYINGSQVLSHQNMFENARVKFAKNLNIDESIQSEKHGEQFIFSSMRNLNLNDVSAIKKNPQSKQLFNSVTDQVCLFPQRKIDHIVMNNSSFSDNPSMGQMRIDQSHNPNNLLKIQGNIPILEQNTEEVSITSGRNIHINEKYHGPEQVFLFQQRIYEMKEQNQKLQTFIENLNEEIKLIIVQKKKLEEEISHKQKKNLFIKHEAQLDKIQLRKIIQEVQQEKNQLAKTFENLKKQNKLDIEKYQILSVKHQQLKSRYESLKEQMEQQMTTNSSQIQRLNQKLSQKNVLVTQLKIQDNHNKLLFEAQISSLREENNEKKQIIQQYQKQIFLKNEKLFKLSDSHEQMRKSFSLNSQISTTELYEKQFTRIKQQFQQQIEIQVQKNIQLTRTNQLLLGDNLLLKEKLVQLQRLVAQGEQRYFTFKEINDQQIRKSQTNLYEVQNDYHIKIEQLQQTNFQLRQQLMLKEALTNQFSNQKIKQSKSLQKKQYPYVQKLSDYSKSNLSRSPIKIQPILGQQDLINKSIENSVNYSRSLQELVIKHEDIIQTNQQMIEQLQDRVYEYLKDALEKEQEAQSLYVKLCDYQNTINGILVQKITTELQNKRLRKVITASEKKLSLLGNQLIKVARQSADVESDEDFSD